MNIELISIIAPAFVVGVMIAFTHAPLGLEVMRRGIIFMDLAIAQFAGLGLIAFDFIFTDSFFQQIGALSFAFLGAIFFRFIEKKLPSYQEAVIGSSFVGAASLSLLLLSNSPHSGEGVEHLLSGQMLFVSWSEIWQHLPVYLFVLICWFYFPKSRNGIFFYALFALAITSSVQLVGVYVVFSSLILPALAVIYVKKHQILYAWFTGLISILLGVIISSVADLPSGPVVVLMNILVASVFLVISKYKLKIIE